MYIFLMLDNQVDATTLVRYCSLMYARKNRQPSDCAPSQAIVAATMPSTRAIIRAHRDGWPFV